MRLSYPAAVPVATSLLLALAACGGKQKPPSSSAPELPSSVVHQVERPEETELPEVPVQKMETERDTLPETLTKEQVDLRVQEAELRPLLMALSSETGVNFVIDPAVKGTVTIDLNGVSLVQALDYLLTPLDYGFEYRRGAIWITKRRLETRVFALNYAVTGRQGSKSLSVGANTLTGGFAGGLGGQGRFGGRTGGGGQAVRGGQAGGGQTGLFGGGFGGGLGGASGVGAGSSTVTSASTATVFQDVRNGLEAIVFGEGAGQNQGTRTGQQATAAGQGAAGAGQQGFFAGGDSQAYSRTDTTGRRLVLNPFAGLVMITASPREIDQAARFLEAVQGSVERQVLIEAEIVEVVLSDEQRAGIDWNALLGDVSVGQSVLENQSNGAFQVNVTGTDVTAILRALARDNDIRTLASPRVSTLNNQKTVLQATTQEVFFSSVQTRPVVADGTVVPGQRQFIPNVIPVGVVIDVTPQVAESGQIIMDIRPSVTEIKGVAESPEGDTQPILDVRTIDTMARVKSGQTIVIGGLIQGRDQRKEEGVPVLKDIPGLGRLFGKQERSNERSQLVIFLTPHLQTGKSMQELTREQRLRLQGFEESFDSGR